MPSPFTASFASTAAGNTNNEGSSNGRNTGSGDWYVWSRNQRIVCAFEVVLQYRITLKLTRLANRSRARTNGATQTFRRPSLAPGFSQKENSQANSNPTTSSGSVYVPPHLNSNYQSSYNRNGSSNESRYSKDQLLDLFKTQEKSGFSGVNLHDLFVDGWSPGNTNGTNNGGWGKRDDSKDASGPEICWDHEGSVHPLALAEMTEDEKEVMLMVAYFIMPPC